MRLAGKVAVVTGAGDGIGGVLDDLSLSDVNTRADSMARSFLDRGVTFDFAGEHYRLDAAPALPALALALKPLDRERASDKAGRRRHGKSLLQSRRDLMKT